MGAPSPSLLHAIGRGVHHQGAADPLFVQGLGQGDVGSSQDEDAPVLDDLLEIGVPGEQVE